jgi:hypothetical protein
VLGVWYGTSSTASCTVVDFFAIDGCLYLKDPLLSFVDMASNITLEVSFTIKSSADAMVPQPFVPALLDTLPLLSELWAGLSLSFELSSNNIPLLSKSPPTKPTWPRSLLLLLLKSDIYGQNINYLIRLNPVDIRPHHYHN